METFRPDNQNELPTPEQEKMRLYEELCKGTPDAIFVLARSLVERRPGEKVVGGYAETDLHGAVNGGHARSIAAAELAEYFPEAKVVANSWVKQEGPVSYAKMSAEQIAAKGIPPERIDIQEESYSTFTELLAFAKMATVQGWKHPVILTSELQIDRAEAMYRHLSDLHDPAGEWKNPEVQQALAKLAEATDSPVAFVAAEKVLEAMGSKYARVVEQARQMPAWNQTLERERMGAQQIERGEYWKDIPNTTIVNKEQ